MTDHPFSCYPGHLEKWRPNRYVEQLAVPPKERTVGYDGAERECVPMGDLVGVTCCAIDRAMSGQITSSTGDQDESHNR